MPPALQNSQDQLLPVLQDRILGSIFGAALGDAIGLYTEFLPASQCLALYPSGAFRLTAPNVTKFAVDSHRAPHTEGEWTDDTDQALCIVLSYLHNNGSLEPKDFAQRLRIWVDQGLRALDTMPLGLGFTIGSIVRKEDFVSDPDAVATQYWVDKRFKPAPNGSLMRTHPLGVFCIDKSIEETFSIAAEYSCVTHADPRCVVSCVIGTALVRALTLGEVRSDADVDRITDAAVEWFRQWWMNRKAEDEDRKGWPDLDREELNRHIQVQDLAQLQLDDSQKMGYVYKTLGSGILLLRSTLSSLEDADERISSRLALFEKQITGLVMQGGDADTNACFAGALLGALLGYTALPPHWREGLVHGKWLLKKSEAVCQILGVIGGTFNPEPDTAQDGARGLLAKEEMDLRWGKHVQMIVKKKEVRDAEKRQSQKVGSWKSAFGLKA